MNLIFLDVDGVLNSQKFADKMFDEECVDVFANDLIDDHAVRLLKALIDETDSRVVLTSTWRKHFESFDRLCQQLRKHGITLYAVIDRLSKNEHRGDDITNWLKENRGHFTNYVILDDDSDMTVHMEHLVQTSFDDGLTRADVDKAIEILKGRKRNGVD